MSINSVTTEQYAQNEFSASVTPKQNDQTDHPAAATVLNPYPIKKTAPQRISQTIR
ncbi:hypothetical protein ACIP5Y_46890 [Nocardia sp. NPDC088792]|uniref:hypothetical protein n=1 Tax=Nocardia sp. NPDC088792 TaxID=3364332 RepID=UPI00381A1B0D